MSADASADPRDEFTLLCEACGYVLEGLDLQVNCPECGKPIRESLPSVARIGTPWQSKPGFRALIATGWAMFVRPGPTLRRMSVRQDSRQLGAFLSLLASAVLVTPPVVYALLFHVTEGVQRGWIAFGETINVLGMTLLVGLAAWVALLFLTVVEETGIRMYGRVHKRRISIAVAETVCAHACIGWITAAVLFWVAAAAAMLIGDPGLGVALLLVALFLGLLHFEVLVWMGVRRCRYANRSRSGGTLPH